MYTNTAAKKSAPTEEYCSFREGRAIVDPLSISKASDPETGEFVVSDDGDEFHVNVREDTCDCVDSRINLPDDGPEQCAHRHHVRYALRPQDIPVELRPHMDRRLVRSMARYAHLDSDERAPVTTEERAAAVVREIESTGTTDADSDDGGEKAALVADGGVEECPNGHDYCERGDGVERPELCFDCWHEVADDRDVLLGPDAGAGGSDSVGTCDVPDCPRNSVEGSMRGLCDEHADDTPEVMTDGGVVTGCPYGHGHCEGPDADDIDPRLCNDCWADQGGRAPWENDLPTTKRLPSEAVDDEQIEREAKELVAEMVDGVAAEDGYRRA